MLLHPLIPMASHLYQFVQETKSRPRSWIIVEQDCPHCHFVSPGSSFSLSLQSVCCVPGEPGIDVERRNLDVSLNAVSREQGHLDHGHDCSG